MNAIVIGCGRVGAAVATALAHDGWTVSCVDQNEDALDRLGSWTGRFVVGHALDVDVLERAGAQHADAAVVATSGDNTNVVSGQLLQKRYEVECVVVRVLDPRRADFYAHRGLRTVCPTQTAISVLTDVVRASRPSPASAAGGE